MKIINTGSPMRFWKCRGQKSFGCLGEWLESQFPGKHPWNSATSEEVVVVVVVVVGVMTPAPPPPSHSLCRLPDTARGDASVKLYIHFLRQKLPIEITQRYISERKYYHNWISQKLFSLSNKHIIKFLN